MGSELSSTLRGETIASLGRGNVNSHGRLRSDFATRTADPPTRLVKHNATDREDRLSILVSEGDLDDRRAVISYLEAKGICARIADEPRDIKHQLASDDYDLMILDLSMGQDVGLALVVDIRSQFDLPLIATVPAHFGESPRAAALELGADDCVAKPVGMRELVARMGAILRRNKRLQGDTGSGGAPDTPRPPRFSRFGGWQIDRRTRRLSAPDGSCVPLTKSEYALLAAFLDYPMVTLSRERLLQATRMQEDLHDRSIDVQIMRLRRKLSPGHERPGIIRTVRSAGYIFMLPVEHIR
jgi:two-component system, OmpR family, response regulator